jgi:hypothetical protein
MSKNPGKLCCPKCSCVIFKPETAFLSETNQSLVSIQNSSQGEIEVIDSFWTVKDMMAFENIGFSREASDGRKYLICADCELGPLGFADIKESLFYIATSRVKNA